MNPFIFPSYLVENKQGTQKVPIWIILYFQAAEKESHESPDRCLTSFLTEQISGQTQRNIKAPRRMPAHGSGRAEFKLYATVSHSPFQELL